MAALSVDRQIPDTKQLETDQAGLAVDYDVAASTTIYKGAFVRIDAGGDIEPCAGTSTEPCLGIALVKADNSDGADGDITCKILVGAVIDHAVGSITKANIGDAVYTSDDQTLTLTSTTNELVGHLVGITGTNKGLIKTAWPGQPAT